MKKNSISSFENKEVKLENVTGGAFVPTSSDSCASDSYYRTEAGESWGGETYSYATQDGDIYCCVAPPSGSGNGTSQASGNR